MPYRYVYSGTKVLKNRLGTRDPDKLEMFERLASIERSTEPVKGFTADIGGLKAVHKTLFQDVYEWAGKTRAEEITIEGQTFTPGKHTLSKGSTTFGATHLLPEALPHELARIRDRLDQIQGRGALTEVKWAEITADQIGVINYTHPFREGNGRTMRRFIELSAERYGFRANITEIDKAQWRRASHDAMDHRQTDALARLIDGVTTTNDPNRSSSQKAQVQKRSADNLKEQPKQGAKLADRAVNAVKRIQDPKRRADAELLLDQIRQTINKGKKTTHQAPRKTGRPGYDFDR